MDYTIAAGPLAVCMLIGMLICLNAGRYLGKRKLAMDPAGAPSRLDARRQLAVEEANAIGAAYLRLDLLPADSQPALREKFRKYTDQ